MATKFSENHYKPFINGRLAKKWSGRLSVNYGNEKSNPRGKETNIYSTDTTQGCSGKCIGCYGAKLCVISLKNFGWIKNVTLHGKPNGKGFLWTNCPNPITDQMLESDIGFNVTVDPMRSISFQNKALREIKRIGSDRVIICFRVYPGNNTSKDRCLSLVKFFRKRGYKRFIQLVVRLNKKQAKKTGSVSCPNGNRKDWYKLHKVKGLGLACGSLGSGKCIDCLICYKVHKAKHRIGTSADPLDRPSHTEKELQRKGFLTKV